MVNFQEANHVDDSKHAHETDNLVQTLQQMNPHVTIFSNTMAQKAKREATREPKGLREGCAHVHSNIDDGTIVLPDPGVDAMRAIYDTGSAIHAAHHPEECPGAKLANTNQLGSTNHTATGEAFYHQ